MGGHMNNEELGRVGYEAYARQTGGLTFDKRKMPDWDELPPNIVAAWTAASAGIREAVNSTLPRWIRPTFNDRAYDVE